MEMPLGIPRYLARLQHRPTDRELHKMIATINLVAGPLSNLPPCEIWKHNVNRLDLSFNSNAAAFAVHLKKVIDAWLDTHADARSDELKLRFIQATVDLLTLPTMVLLSYSNLTQRAKQTPVVKLQYPDGSTENLVLPLIPKPAQAGARPNLEVAADVPGGEHNEAAEPLPRPPASQRPNDEYDPSSSLQRAATAALRLVHQGKEGKASKTLLSSGIAKPDAHVNAIMDELHPRRAKELILPQPAGPQVKTSADSLAKSLATDAGHKADSLDPFGWAPNLLSGAKLKKHTDEKPSLLVQMSRFMAIVSDCDVPHEVAVLITAGALLGANKIPEEEQLLRVSQGLPKLIRPINRGSMMMKRPMQAAVRSPAGKRAQATLRPFQLGMGVSAGPEKMALIARATYLSDGAIGSNDQVAAFQRIERQAMIDAVHERFPEAGRIFNTYYGLESPVLYFYVDENKIPCCSIYLSSTGSRQGCVFGSAAFNLTVHPLYEKLAQKYPNFTLRALTDDLPVFAYPGIGEWPQFYTDYAKYLHDFDRLAKPLGIKLHPDKMCLLLPEAAPAPSAMALGMFPSTLTITRKGIIIAGAPIGTDEHVCEHADKKVQTALSACCRLDALAIIDTQAAWRLLRSVSQSLGYYTRVTPPELTAQALGKLADGIFEAILRHLTPTQHTVPNCAAERLKRAKQLAELPIRMGGLGFTPASSTSAAAFLSSMAAACSERAFTAVRKALQLEGARAYEMVLESIGGAGEIMPGSNLHSVLPPNADGVCATSFYPDLIQSKPNVKVQRIIAAATSLHRRDVLREESHPDRVQDFGNCLTDSDATQTHLATSRSQVTRILQSPLWFRNNRVPLHTFVPYMRFYLLLPQLVVSRNSTHSARHGCQVAVCACCHKKTPAQRVLDPSGNHACACPTTCQARSSLHTLYCKSIARLAALAGLEASLEPSTVSILNNEYDRDECRLLCPKNATKKSNALATKMNALKRTIKNKGARDDQAAVNDAKKRLEALKGEATDDMVGRRIDIVITDPHDGSAWWVDASGVHSTAKSYLPQNKTFVKHLASAEAKAKEDNKPNSMNKTPSPAVAERTKKKHKTYLQLVQAADAQVHDGTRQIKVNFAPAVFTHSGEICPATFALIQWMANKYRDKLKREGPRDDGLSKELLGASYRRRCKDTLAAATVNGFGGMLLSAGRSMPRARAARRVAA
jgi:hypothetical protein